MSPGRIVFAYLLIVFALGYAAAEWSWWIALGVVPLTIAHGYAQAWAEDRQRANARPGSRVIEEERW